MQDNGRGTPRKNVTTVGSPGSGDGGEGDGGRGGGGGGGIRVDGILDNPDPANLIQRIYFQEGAIKTIDNIPVEQARQLFEQSVKSASAPIIAELREKACGDKDYLPTDEELAAVRVWLNQPELYLDEGNLQRMYDFPAGSVWDFFVNVLGVRKIPTPADRIESGFEQYLTLYNFTPKQVEVLGKIKQVFVANVSSGKPVDLEAILAIRFTSVSSGGSTNWTRSSMGV